MHVFSIHFSSEKSKIDCKNKKVRSIIFFISHTTMIAVALTITHKSPRASFCQVKLSGVHYTE